MKSYNVYKIDGKDFFYLNDPVNFIGEDWLKYIPISYIINVTPKIKLNFAKTFFIRG